MPEIPPPSAEALLRAQTLVKYEPPQVLVKCQAAAPEVALNFNSKKERPILLPPSIVDFIPTTVIDTSAPTCVTILEDYMLNRLANADPRNLVFNIINPATRLPDDVFKASMINRYRIVNGIAHEVLPGASVLKRFREELGESSKRASVLKRFREELGESSESASVLKRFREELGEPS
ncbi:hypothetical protein Tco_1207776 [Tanacetum coccineum]